MRAAIEAQLGAFRHAALDHRTDSLFFLHYDHADLGNAPLGYMVENRVLRAALAQAITDDGARILLVFAPWPGEGHYRGDAKGG